MIIHMIPYMVWKIIYYLILIFMKALMIQFILLIIYIVLLHNTMKGIREMRDWTRDEIDEFYNVLDSKNAALDIMKMGWEIITYFDKYDNYHHWLVQYKWNEVLAWLVCRHRWRCYYKEIKKAADLLKNIVSINK